MQTKPTPADVKEARISAGLTLKEAAEIFGYQLNTWQMKESAGKATSSVASGFPMMILLLAGKHPEYVLCKRDTITAEPTTV